MDVMIDGVRYAPVVEDEVALSILVPSVSSRRSTFAPKIADALFGQHEELALEDQRRVEILMLTDAKGIVIGDKRNRMVQMARGKYVVFVDDDDRIEPDYIASLLQATQRDADCITFDAAVSLNGQLPKICQYSMQFSVDANTAGGYQRLPNHITAVKRMLALACPFPLKQKGEDSDYAARLKPMLRSEYRIERVLYHYDFNEATTETQRERSAIRLLPKKRSDATVDLIILSKASTPALRAMCQNAISSAVKGAGNHKVNVIVMEADSESSYVDAQVYRNPGEFNYNRTANQAAGSYGNAEWIMVANSDLIFEDGWLDALLMGGHDLVSPLDPNHKTQRTIKSDEAGWKIGHHFSGWCFMIRRELWKKIGGFDECVKYWCSDNVVVEQCRAVGVMPRLVAAARVKHLGSATEGSPPDDMTWAQVKIFNEKYPARPIFTTDPRYLQYLRKIA